MSQSMSVEAVLSAYDESFSATLDKALKSINNLGRETQSISQTVSAGGSSISSTFKSIRCFSALALYLNQIISSH